MLEQTTDNVIEDHSDRRDGLGDKNNVNNVNNVNKVNKVNCNVVM